MTKRKILLGPLPPPYGGVAIYMQTLAAHLADRTIRIWSYSGKGNDKRVRFIADGKFATTGALLAEGRDAKILDASHFHLEYPNPFLLSAWLILKRLLHFEWNKNVHDGSLPRRYPQFTIGQRWLFRRALNNVDRFVVVNEGLRRWLMDEMQVRQPILVIPSLLPDLPNEEAASPSAETDELIRPYLSHERRVCSIGAFSPRYGFGDAADAVERLRSETNEDVGLILLDGGFVRDEEYRAKVLHNRDWITVLEKVPNSELRRILRLSDIFVRGFADESYGISRVEAIWCGVPVVATTAGETRGMLVYDFGDQDQLSQQLRTALLDSARQDTEVWAARYRLEAEENLRALCKVIGV